MYSKKAARELENRGVKEGDRIEAAALGRKLTGTLMPRIEAGDENVLIIKLDNGYNAGISIDHCDSIRKLPTETTAKPQAQKITFDETKPKIALVATGGTISTRVDYKTGGVFMTLDPLEILQTTPQIGEIANITAIDSPFRIASEDMSPKEWAGIAKTIETRLNEECAGAIVTHGTDTLHYTAAALSFMLPELTKPVALVGAQRSPDRGSFDGRLNLTCAAHYAVGDMAHVAVVMHGSSSDDYCHANFGTKVRKMHTSRRDAFKPINAKPLATIWQDGRMEKLDGYRKATWSKTTADTRFEDRIAIVKAFPGSDPEIIDYYLSKKLKGLIIEGTGLGHVPTETIESRDSWIPHVRNATEEGMLIGITSQCINGRTNAFVYRNLRILAGAGAVHLDDMTTETAYVKLGCMLGREKKQEKVKELMLTNMAGELNPRITQEM